MSNKPTPQTLLGTAIENRNYFQGRLINNMVDVIYFTKKMETAKPDTQERVDAKKSIAEAQNNIKDTEILLASFDELISTLKAAEKKE